MFTAESVDPLCHVTLASVLKKNRLHFMFLTNVILSFCKNLYIFNLQQKIKRHQDDLSI